MKKFWNWIKDSDETRTLRLEGPIDEESSGVMKLHRRCSGMS